MNEMMKNSGMYQRLTSSTRELERLFTEVDEKKNPPDIKKILLLMGLGTLSWISTYSGLLELIKANSGDIAFTYKLAIGFAVAMLMLMIVYILDQLFAPLNWLLRTIYIFGYIFLTIISVGFGFGFYWKFLESRSEATRSAESAITQVQTALQGGQTRLEQLEQTLTSLTALSIQKAKDEREKGNSCPNSRPGDGPRRRLRDQDAKNFSFAGDFITKRAQSVADDITALNKELAKVASRHPSTIDPKTGTRNAFMKSLSQRLDMTITRFNAFRTDPQLAGIRNNLSERAATTRFPLDQGGTFNCPDPQLQGALRGVVSAIDQLPLLKKPVINAVEGSEATIEAFRRLGATLSGLLVLKMPPSEDELRALRKKAVRSFENKNKGPVVNAVQPGLNERDYIPLAIAVFVDFCLLLVSINRPMDRLKSLVPVMKEARDGPISGILSSFHATHFAGIREEFSLFQHVVFDWGGHYYVAVPLASNDIQAQYLANLFVSLEGRGIVDRAMIPPAFIIRGKLKKMGSSFADHRAFRLYKFRNGAWSNIVMDAVMGAAKDVSIANAAAEKAALEKASRFEKHTEPLIRGSAKAANFDSLFQSPVITVKSTVKGEAGDEDAQKQQAGDELDGGTFAGIAESNMEMPRLFQTGKKQSADNRPKSEPEAHNAAEKYEASGQNKQNNNHKRSLQDLLGLTNTPPITDEETHQHRQNDKDQNRPIVKAEKQPQQKPLNGQETETPADTDNNLKRTLNARLDEVLKTTEETAIPTVAETIEDSQPAHWAEKTPEPPIKTAMDDAGKAESEPQLINKLPKPQPTIKASPHSGHKPQPKSEIAVGKITRWFAGNDQQLKQDEKPAAGANGRIKQSG